MIQSQKLQTKIVQYKDHHQPAGEGEDLLAVALGAAAPQSRDDQLARLQGLLLGLRERHHELSASDLNKCQDIAATLINMVTTPGSPIHNHSYYSALQRCKAEIAVSSGKNWRSLWHELLSFYADQSERSRLAAFALRRGHAETCLQILSDSESADELDPEEEFLKIKACLLSDLEPAQFSELLHRNAAKPYLPWAKAVLTVKATGDLRDLSRLVRTDPNFATSYYLLQFQLWAFAVKSRRWQKNLVRLASLKKRKGIEISGQKPIVKFLQVIEECYDYERPLTNRLERLGESLERISEVETIDEELLAWAAAARFLWRSRAKSMALVCQSEYQKICLCLSRGQSADTLGLLGDIDAR